MNEEVLEAKIKQLEKNQDAFVLREVFDIFKEELRSLREIAHENKNTNMKLIGALVLFKIVYAPLIFIVLRGWMG